jgi:hypothetical protein
MDRLHPAALFGSIALGVLTAIAVHAQQVPNDQLDMKSAFTNADFSSLPAMPRGKSTILGGQIGNVDPVLDELTLHIYGEHPMKILFDERTQVYRDGVHIPLSGLKPGERASVQTALEGSNVFAISIHMLSSVPQGQCQGHVLGYDPSSRELLVGSALSREPVRLFLREGAPVVRQGQPEFASHSEGEADLVNGALVTVNFNADEKGRAIADRVTVLAEPGADFVFSGKVTALDMPSGSMTLLDPRDQKSYQIWFNPAQLPASESVRVGAEVRVTAAYDGTRYNAVDMMRNPASQR